VPLLIGAEVFVHKRLKVTIPQFLDRGLIQPKDQARFKGILASGMRMRDSVLAEVLILAAAIFMLFWQGNLYISLLLPTWYATPVGDQTHLMAAGYWYFFFSLIIFRFLLLRWYYRLFIWHRFLWQVSREIPLQLNALHPDRAGGLGFLSGMAFAFQPVLLAHTIGLSGFVGAKIWHEGATLPQFKLELVAWMLILLLMVLAPLFFFVIQLSTAKRRGLRQYGALASRYVTDFRCK
jgi:hypothetical protein